MNVSNVRIGFATNSSSTHSVVIIPPGKKLRDNCDGQEFGWGDFTLSSKESKMLYLGQTIVDNIKHDVGEHVARAFASSLVGMELEDGYVDHQSRINLPYRRMTYGKAELDREFIAELLDHVAKNNQVVILGGNDNSDGHPMAGKYDNFLPANLPVDMGGKFYSRKDGEWWVLFNPDNGSKIRLSFSGKDGTYTKSSAPELVDLSITDYCKHGCSFCYKDCTEKGKHASRGDVEHILYGLAEAGVFEIALGGGDILAHPDVCAIIDSAYSIGFVVNITTKDLRWIKNGHPLAKMLGEIGGVAFSPQYPHYALEGLAVAMYHGMLSKISMNIIPEISGESNTDSLVSVAKMFGVPVTLLGVKACGRYKKLGSYKMFDWASIVKKHGVRCGIDTVLAAQSEKLMSDSGISSKLYSIDEGKFSCYIDAVSKRIAASSFADSSAEYNSMTWLSEYRKF